MTLVATDLSVLRVQNDSMERTIQNGDWVLLDLNQKRLTRSGIYGLAVGEDVWIKWIEVELAEERIRIISDNLLYPVQYASKDQIKVVGHVLAVVMRKI